MGSGDTLTIPDISEYQKAVTWASYPYLAIIVRLFSGYRKDLYADRNIEGARSRCQVRGWYSYLASGTDPVWQASQFAAILKAHGGLRRGEFVICDSEEGGGDQGPRVRAFLARCDALLGERPDQDWVYSAPYFWSQHLASLGAKYHRWIASYGSGEPSLGHELWQRTSSGHVAGIGGPVDLSLFHGNIADLLHLVGGVQEDEMTPFLFTVGTDIYISNLINFTWVPDPNALNAIRTVFPGIRDMGKINGVSGLGVPADPATAARAKLPWPPASDAP